MNTFYEFSDGMFTYFVNIETGEKKFKLEPGYKIVEPVLEDFYRNRYDA